MPEPRPIELKKPALLEQLGVFNRQMLQGGVATPVSRTQGYLLNALIETMLLELNVKLEGQTPVLSRGEAEFVHNSIWIAPEMLAKNERLHIQVRRFCQADLEYLQARTQPSPRHEAETDRLLMTSNTLLKLKHNLGQLQGAEEILTLHSQDAAYRSRGGDMFSTWDRICQRLDAWVKPPA